MGAGASALVMGGGATPGAASLQGQTDPGSRCQGAAPVIPDRCRRSAGRRLHAAARSTRAGLEGRTPRRAAARRWSAPWKGTPMATKRKPQTENTTDEAREQMRRALQTSMDTRQ
ncbi:hypothetical protein GCM10010169_12340 [Micromonospora fulviviridis]|nr:hypothetical protein GCM10010169_12340 [Micromonospora fulviviridis]